MKNKRKSSTYRERIQEADKTLQILHSPLIKNNCKNCKHWEWTHNMWGDCSNPKIAKSPETLDVEDSYVLITNIPRTKQTHLSTLEEFGCILFEKKEG